MRQLSSSDGESTWVWKQAEYGAAGECEAPWVTQPRYTYYGNHAVPPLNSTLRLHL